MAGPLFASDHAFPPPPSVLKAAGIIASNVYVSGQYAQSASHVNALRAAGLGAWPNYERGLWELVSNRSAGQAAARIGIEGAIRCEFPADGTIWFPFSVDVNVPTSSYGAVADAFRGIQDINAGRYLISFYGQGDLAKYLRANRIIDQKCWLSASTAFPGWSASSPDICIWQQVGNYIPGYSTDRNVITDVSALHAHWPADSPYANSSTGDDMTPEEHQFLQDTRQWVSDIRYAVVTSDPPLRTIAQNAVNAGNSATAAGNNATKAATKAGTDTVAAVNALDFPTTAEIVAAIKADPPVVNLSLSDAQLAALVTAIAAALPAQKYTGNVTLDPVGPA
jgi:hypothetical protein